MAGLKNHPGMWLNEAAAAAINALEDKYGPIRINDAGRTVQQQQDAINRWDRGGAANRPPYLYEPFRPAANGPHVRNGGEAVDVFNYTSDRAKLNEFGFEWYGPSDPVHYTFRGWNGGSGASFDSTVQREQNFLNVARGENLAVDGIKGPATTDAYKRYQEFLRGYGYGGAIDGIWGGGTQAAHENFYREWEARNSGNRPSNKSAGELNYADIQTALNRHGYNLVVDNDWGPKSSNALADFQSRNGLTVDRIVGPATWEKLNR